MKYVPVTMDGAVSGQYGPNLTAAQWHLVVDTTLQNGSGQVVARCTSAASAQYLANELNQADPI